MSELEAEFLESQPLSLVPVMLWEQTWIRCAVSAVQDNKEANQIEDDTFDMMIGNIIDDVEVQNEVGYERYDIVAANILADVLVPLTPVIVHQMKRVHIISLPVSWMSKKRLSERQ